jgi:type IV pilus assembly protein PilX
MFMAKRTDMTAPQRQRGMTMIVALIMLLLLTLIGVAGMRDNQLQEKMSGGTEDRDTAFQAAESALREAELQIVNGPNNYSGSCSKVTAPTLGCYVMPGSNAPSRTCTNTTGNTCSESDYWAQYAWTTNANSAAYAGTGLTQVGTQPRYVIEQLPAGFSPVPGTQNGGASVASGAKMITDFLITARGTGRTSDAVVILQSLYRTVQ